MQTIIIYDDEGFIIQQVTGTYRIPVGVSYLEIELLEGQYADSVDVNIQPHQPIILNAPPTELEELKNTVSQLQYTLMMEGVL